MPRLLIEALIGAFLGTACHARGGWDKNKIVHVGVCRVVIKREKQEEEGKSMRGEGENFHAGSRIRGRIAVWYPVVCWKKGKQQRKKEVEKGKRKEMNQEERGKEDSTVGSYCWRRTPSS